jgi:hypothetical protein
MRVQARSILLPYHGPPPESMSLTRVAWVSINQNVANTHFACNTR